MYCHAPFEISPEESIIQLHALLFIENLPLSRQDVEVVFLTRPWYKSNAGLVVIFKYGLGYHASLVLPCIITVHWFSYYYVVVVRKRNFDLPKEAAMM